MKGFINIFKPVGMTSSDVVVKVRGILRRATSEKQKVGHLGTLDPLAVGVLPIAVGNATRLFDFMQEKKKTYIATFRFGVTTDTLDRGGKIIEPDNIDNTFKALSARDGKITELTEGSIANSVTKDEILKILPEMCGEVMQIPPQYSAKSVNGKRAYDIARSGEVADLKPKQVSIDSIELLACDGENVELPCDVNDHGDYNIDKTIYKLSENEFAFRITCGSGTYIRSIVRDMAEKLGTVGFMTSLCRLSSGQFELSDAITIKQFEENPLGHVMPIDIAVKDYVKIDLDESDGKKALNGVPVAYVGERNIARAAVSVTGELVALGEVKNGNLRLTVRL